ncbi:MAG: hypothetical protein Q8Q09_02430 [Deltaproteobacteria bacterium]|nr:hypothetical protein [Deltaproteobacteria bacterium]
MRHSQLASPATLRALALTAALAHSSATQAQSAPTTPPNAQVSADAAVARGVTLRQAGNDDEALVEFRRAHQLAPSARTQAQIALAEQALGQWVSAEQDLQAALAVTTDPWIERNRESLANAMRQISTRLASIEVRCSTPNAELFVNDVRASALPLTAPVRVAVGTVTLEVRAPGYTTQRRTLEIPQSAQLREVFSLAAVSPGQPSTTVTEPSTPTAPSATNTPSVHDAPAVTPTPGPSLVGPLVVVSVGAASLALSGVFGALRGTALGACPYDSATDTLQCNGPMATAQAQAGPGYTTALNVTLIGGAVVLAAGGSWLIAALLNRPASARPASERPQAWVMPSIQPHSVALHLGGSF